MNLIKNFRGLMIGLAIGGLMVSACGSAVTAIPNTPTPLPPTPTQFVPPATNLNSNELTGTKWLLVSLNGTAVPVPTGQSKPVTLEFGPDGQASGSGGCNSYGGTYQVQNSALTFGPLISTMMACADDTAMQQEAQYFKVLQASSQFTQTADQLVITDGSQQTLTFSPMS